MFLSKYVKTWVITDVIIPQEFSPADEYTKTYALRSYDIDCNLKKQLKDWEKWWCKERNSERRGVKSNETTIRKRKERILCFLGFTSIYKCLPKSKRL